MMFIFVTSISIGFIGCSKADNNSNSENVVQSGTDNTISDDETKDESQIEDEVKIIEKEADISACFSLMQELRPHLKSEDFTQQVLAQFKEGYHLFAMIKESQIVTLCGCRISANLAWGKHLYIDDLISSGSGRSLGYGKEMMAYLISFAKEKGCEKMHLDSGVQRFQAHKFYLREGFKIASHHFSQEL